MKLNMQLDFVNRSPNGGKLSVVARSFGAGRRRPRRRYAIQFLCAGPRHLADGRDLISIIISGGGRFRGRWRARPRPLGRHGAAVLESRRESALHSLDDGTAWTICMERAPLEPLLAGVQEPLQRCLPGDNAGLRLLRGLSRRRCSRSSRIAISRSRRCTSAISRSARSACAATRRRWCANAASRPRARARCSTRSPGAPASRTRSRARCRSTSACRCAICTGCWSRPDARSPSICSERRLDRAAAMLRDPDCAHLKIGEIAAQAGFADISHFNRSFRRMFGDTPLGVRVRAAAPAGVGLSRYWPGRTKKTAHRSAPSVKLVRRCDLRAGVPRPSLPDRCRFARRTNGYRRRRYFDVVGGRSHRTRCLHRNSRHRNNRTPIHKAGRAVNRRSSTPVRRRSRDRDRSRRWR